MFVRHEKENSAFMDCNLDALILGFLRIGSSLIVAVVVVAGGGSEDDAADMAIASLLGRSHSRHRSFDTKASCLPVRRISPLLPIFATKNDRPVAAFLAIHCGSFRRYC
jgi:hypothetical protein